MIIIIKKLLWFIFSDVKLIHTECCDIINDEMKNRIDGFYFYTKYPFSKSYQYHSAIGLNYTYEILKSIQDSIKQKQRALLIEVSVGMGIERIYIWKGSFKKAEKQMLDMIKKIQEQY